MAVSFSRAADPDIEGTDVLDRRLGRSQLRARDPARAGCSPSTIPATTPVSRASSPPSACATTCGSKGRRAVRRIVARTPRPADAARLPLRTAEGVLLIPTPLHALQPRADDRRRQLDLAHPGRVPTLIDAGTGDPRHLDAVAAAARRHGARPGPGHARAHRPRVGSRGPGDTHAARAVPQDAVARARRSCIPCRGIRSPTTTSWQRATHRSWRCTRPDTRPITSASGTRRRAACSAATSCRRGGTIWIPGNRQGDLAAYIASLERVLALEPARMFPAHGPVIDEPVRAAAPVHRPSARARGAGARRAPAGRLHAGGDDDAASIAG